MKGKSIYSVRDTEGKPKKLTFSATEALAFARGESPSKADYHTINVYDAKSGHPTKTIEYDRAANRFRSRAVVE